MTAARKTSNYDRQAADWYREPRWCVDLLLDAEPIEGDVWDPACGGGTIAQACADRGIFTDATDLHDRGFGRGGIDFLAPWVNPEACADNIICNPPYGLFEEWLQRCLILARRKVCLLSRLAVLEGMRRYRHVWSMAPPSRVWVLSKRPSMPPGDQPEITASGGKVAYCWLVWDVGGRTGPTQLGWLCPEKETA